MDKDGNEKKLLNRKRDNEIRERKQREEDSLKELQKVKREKARKAYTKNKQKSFWKLYGDYFGYAGIALFFAALIYMNYSGDRRKLKDIPINEDTHIQSHNEYSDKYELQSNTYFEGLSLEDARKMVNSKLTNKTRMPRCDTSVLKGVLIHDQFNFYEEHNRCRVHRELGKNSGSYVEMPTNLMVLKMCLYGLIQSPQDFELSTDHIYSCDKKENNRERGGYVMSTLNYGKKEGYISKQCWEKVMGDRTEEEQKECPSDKELEDCKRYKVQGFCALEGIDEIKREIIKNGPVLSVIKPYRNFFIYNKGTFDFGKQRKLDGFLLVNIVGWGLDNEGDEYWVVENQWGKDWGLDGFAHVYMGHEDSLLDKFAITIYPLSEK